MFLFWLSTKLHNLTAETLFSFFCFPKPAKLNIVQSVVILSPLPQCLPAIATSAFSIYTWHLVTFVA